MYILAKYIFDFFKKQNPYWTQIDLLHLKYLFYHFKCNMFFFCLFPNI